MKSDNCGNCIFWERQDCCELGDGDCRLNPPIFLPLKEDKSVLKAINWMRPQTMDYDWCGQFKAKRKQRRMK